MDHTTFPFGANFPSISAAAIDAACTTIETEWSGIFELYATTANPAGKQAILEGYLVGWWLADMNPSSASGIGADGGMPGRGIAEIGLMPDRHGQESGAGFESGVRACGDRPAARLSASRRFAVPGRPAIGHEWQQQRDQR